MRSVAQPSPAPTPPAKMNTLPILAKKLLKKRKIKPLYRNAPFQTKTKVHLIYPRMTAGPRDPKNRNPRIQNPESTTRDPETITKPPTTIPHTPSPANHAARRAAHKHIPPLN